MIIKGFTLITRKIILSMFWSNFLVWPSITSKQMSCWYFVLRTSLFLWNIYRKKTSLQHTLCEEYVLFSQKLFLTLVSNFYKTSKEMAERRGTLSCYLMAHWNTDLQHGTNLSDHVGSTAKLVCTLCQDPQYPRWCQSIEKAYSLNPSPLFIRSYLRWSCKLYRL